MLWRKMNRFVISPSFIKAYKKFVKRFAFLQERIDDRIKLLEKDIYDKKLQTHKLSGKLLGAMACSCGYDCRIIFAIEKDTNGSDVIILISIGTHDEV